MSVMWNRIYGKEKFANLYDRYFACQQLKMTLELTGCKRLVIGHTPQVYFAQFSGDALGQLATLVFTPAYELVVTAWLSSLASIVKQHAFCRDGRYASVLSYPLCALQHMRCFVC